MFKLFTKHVIVFETTFDCHFLVDHQIDVLVIFLITREQFILIVLILVRVLLD
jgi:hypothetical protein